jgi:hypothetical protein
MCGVPIERTWDLEHVNPLSLGGPHLIENLEVSCSRCNRSKGSLTLEELLGPDVAERLREGLLTVGPSVYVALAIRPTAALWELEADLGPREIGRIARRFSCHPLPFSYPGLDEEDYPPALDRLVQALLRQPDPYRAMSLDEIAAAAGYRNSNRCRKYWDLSMGINGNVNDYLGSRSTPHPYIQPVRIGPIVADGVKRSAGLHGFRLRFRTLVEPLEPGAGGPDYLGGWRISPDSPSAPGAVPDLDEAG